MARILRIIVNPDGYISVKDDHRPNPVSVCCDGTRDLIIWLRLAKNTRMRYILTNRIPYLKGQISRYLIKLAVDNFDRADEIIDGIYNCIGNENCGGQKEIILRDR